MPVPFNITWSLRDRRDPNPVSEGDFVGASDVFVALQQFLGVKEGEFTVRIGAAALRFSLDPDLSTIFEELPGVLDALTQDVTPVLKLNFFEQGTDFVLEFERKRKAITVRLLAGDDASEVLRAVNETTLVVDATQFLKQWTTFTRAMLTALTLFKRGLLLAKSYRSYVRRLSRVEEYLKEIEEESEPLDSRVLHALAQFEASLRPMTRQSTPRFAPLSGTANAPQEEFDADEAGFENAPYLQRYAEKSNALKGGFR